MKVEKTDRRTLRTRRLLGRALTDLMMVKRFDQITVQDIIDRADVGRSTFYMHYQDKEDLLLSEFEQMLAALSTAMSAREPDGRDREGEASENAERVLPVLELFQHIQDAHGLYQAIVRGHRAELLFRRGHAFLSGIVERNLRQEAGRQGRTPVVPLPITANYVAGTLIIHLQWWLDNDMPYSPQEMDEMFRLLVMPGVRAALGE